MEGWNYILRTAKGNEKCIPIGEGLEIDERTETTQWKDIIRKEMKIFFPSSNLLMMMWCPLGTNILLAT